MTMRAIDIDFRRAGPPARWLGGALLLAGAAAAAAAAWHLQAMSERADAMEAILRRANVALRPAPPVPLTPAELRKVASGARRANQVLMQLNVPWPKLFAMLEEANTQDAALLGIESDLDKRRVKITVEARNLNAMLEYVRSLESQPVLAAVRLQAHSTQQQDPQRPIRFTLMADWVDSK